MWIETKKGKKENVLPIGFCDDSTSQMTGNENKELMANDNEEENGLQHRVFITLGTNLKR